MSRIVRYGFCCGFLWVTSLAWAQAPPAAEVTDPANAPVLHEGDGQTLAVYAARSVPAEDLANLVRNLVGEDGNLRLEAERQHNSLVLHGPSDAIAVVLKLLKTLDQPPVKIQFRLWAIGIPCDRLEDVTQMLSTDLSAGDVGARLQQAQADGQLKVLDHISLATVAGQPAAVQVGQNLPVAMGEQQTQHGRARNYTMNMFGLMTKLNADVTGDQVTVELTYEKSEPRRTENAADSADVFTPDGTVTRQTNVTTVLRSGTATLLSGGPLPGVEGCTQWRLVLSVQTESP